MPTRKRLHQQGSALTKRNATTDHATERTGVDAATHTRQGSDHQGHTPPKQQGRSLPLINNPGDVISIIGPHAGEGEEYRTLHLDAEKLKNAKLTELRTLCKP